jgi:putative hemolysin
VPRTLTGSCDRTPDGGLFRIAQDSIPVSRQYQTFAGFLLQEFDAIPNVGDRIESNSWRFEIADLHGRRIDKVLATTTDNSKA